MKPTTVAIIGPEGNEFTVEAIISNGSATGHMQQTSKQTLIRAINELTRQMTLLEAGSTQQRFNYEDNARRLPHQPPPRDQTASVTCYRCGKEAHYAKGCDLRYPSRQRNGKPPRHRPGSGG